MAPKFFPHLWKLFLCLVPAMAVVASWRDSVWQNIETHLLLWPSVTMIESWSNEPAQDHLLAPGDCWIFANGILLAALTTLLMKLWVAIPNRGIPSNTTNPFTLSIPTHWILTLLAIAVEWFLVYQSIAQGQDSSVPNWSVWLAWGVARLLMVCMLGRCMSKIWRFSAVNEPQPGGFCDRLKRRWLLYILVPVFFIPIALLQGSSNISTLLFGASASLLIIPAITAMAIWITSLHNKKYIFQYLYFLRAPAIATLLAWAVPILGLASPLSNNWFDVNLLGAFCVAVVSTLLSWAIMYQYYFLWSELHLENEIDGPDQKEKTLTRHMPLWLGADGPTKEKASDIFWRLLFFQFAIAIPTISATLLYSGNLSLLLGAIFGAIAVYIVPLLAYDISRRAVYTQSALSSAINCLRKFENKIFRLGTSRQALTKARYYAYATFIVYLGMALIPAHHLPVLVYVLLLLFLVSWVTSVTTFFLDKYRIPVLILLLLVPALLPSEHYYSVMRLEDVAPAASRSAVSSSAQAPLQEKESSKQPSNGVRIAVAASGGGITAAYWTNVVLNSIEEQHPGFANRVGLVSGISGGSIGGLAYVHGQHQGNLPGALDASGKSSLSSIGHGFVYYDYWRRFVPMFTAGRGESLEASLQKNIFGDSSSPNLEDFVGPPYLALGATVVETGHRFVFSNYSFGPSKKQSCKPTEISERTNTKSTNNEQEPDSEFEPKYFRNLYPCHTTKWVTAARMSATFPYVSPIARPSPSRGMEEAKAYHLADGGYAENWGVATALDYLDQELSQGNSGQSLLIEIRAFAQKDSQGDAVTPGLMAPLSTMLKVRTASQIERNNRDLRSREKSNNLSRVIFTYDNDRAPLSWHLSKEESEDIRKAVENPINAKYMTKLAIWVDKNMPALNAHSGN